MTPAEYHAAIVSPTVAEFLAAPLDLRRGVLAALVLYHLADCVAADTSRKIDDVRTDLAKRCADLLLLGDVANATKHVRLDRRARRRLDHLDQVKPSPPGLFAAPFGYGVFAEAAGIVVQLNDKTTRPLLELVQTVHAMWIAWLAEATDTRPSASVQGEPPPL